MNSTDSKAVVQDSVGRTDLHLAAEKNDLNKMEEVLQSGEYEVNLQDVKGRTVLHCLLDKNPLDELDDIKRGIQILLDHGVDVNVQDKFMDTPLHSAINSYDRFAPDIIRFFLQKSEFNMEIQNNVGYTVYYCFMVGFRDSLKEEDFFDELVADTELFINDYLEGKFQVCNVYPAGQLLNRKDVYGYSAFHMYISSAEYEAETVRRMIKSGADVNTKSNINITPLMDAVSDRQPSLVEILLEAGADPNVRDVFGQTAIFRVLTKECFDLLHKYGADFNIKDNFGRTPMVDRFLYSAEDSPRSGMSLSDNISVYRPLVESFIECGLSCNETDMFGSSLLHYASWYGDPKMISTLLKNGADRELVDDTGVRPIDLARHVGNFNICKLLDKENCSSVDEEIDPFTRYSNVFINHGDVSNMDQVLRKCLQCPEDPFDLITKVVSSPRIGLTDKQGETKALKADVLQLMQKIAASVSATDPVFRCSVFPTGSLADGTKIGDPDEFDFMFCLEYFSEECVPCQSLDILNSGFALLKLKSFKETHPLVPYVTEELFIESNAVRDTFQEYVTTALNRSEMWDFKNVYFDGLIRFPTDKPIMNFNIQWFGRTMKDIVVSIDVVPAVTYINWIPREMENVVVKTPSTTTDITDSYFLLFQPPQILDEFHRRFLRISRSNHELHMLRSLPNYFLESYAAAKILVSDYFCPRVQFNQELDVESIFDKDATAFYDDMDVESDNIDELEQTAMNNYGNITSQRVYDLEEVADEEIAKNVMSMDDYSAVQGVTLFKNGSVNELVSWIVEMDETLRVRKLFSPKVHVEMANVSLFQEGDDLFAKITNKTITVRKGNSTWIRYGPMKQQGECSIDESLRTFEDKVQNLQELRDRQVEIDGNITVLEWLTDVLNPNPHSVEKTKESSHCDRNMPLEEEKMNTDAENTNTFATACDLSLRPGSDIEMSDNEKADENSDEGPLNDSLKEKKYDLEWEGGEIVHASDEISSYMLKNCLFNVATNLESEPDLGPLEITIKIFEELQQSARVGRLNSFFLPFLDIFSFSNSHIRMVPDEELEKATRNQCSRIQIFCDVILGILRYTNNEQRD